MIIMSKLTVSQIYVAAEKMAEETQKSNQRQRYPLFMGRAESAHNRKHHDVNFTNFSQFLSKRPSQLGR